MGLTIYCENVKGETIYEQLGTDICRVTSAKWEASLMTAILLLGLIIYMLWKFKYRCHKTLLTFHNLRAAVALLLFAINTIELAKALLPLPSNINGGVGKRNNGANGYENINKGNGSESNLPQQQEQPQQQTFIDTEPDHIIVVIGFASLANALSALILTIMLMVYHRLVELKKSLEFLYVSSTLSVLIFILRIYELAEIVYYDSVLALECVIQASSAFCLLLLAIIDGFTIYKERYRPDYLEDYDKIGYKHTLATFYSKACFWWLVPLLWFGYKEPLELEDLGQMRLEDSARAHYDRFLLIYKTAKVRNSNKPPSLWLVYLKSSWRMFTLGGLLKLFGDLFAVIGPLAIQQIVQYIENMYGMHMNINNKDNNALQQMHTTQSNMTNSNQLSGDNSNTSVATPEKQSSLLAQAFSTSLSASASPLSTLLSLKENGNLGKSIKSHINIQAAVVKTIQKAVAQATGSIWMPNLNVSYTNDNNTNTSNIFYNNNNYNNTNNTNVYKQITNGIDYTDTTTYSSDSLYSSSLYSSQSYSNDTEVKIYYPTWLDLLSNGWAIAWIVLLAALAQGALSQASTHILNMTGIRIKTSLQGLIYRKTLLLNSTCINGSTDGTISQTTTTKTTNHDSNSYTNKASAVTLTPEAGNKIENSVKSNCPNISNNNHKDSNYLKGNKIDRDEMENSLSDIGAITNLMSEDTLNIMSFFWIAHYVWAIPLKIGIVMYLLYLKLGISAVIGSFVCILTMTPLQFLIGKAMSKNAEVMAGH